MARASASAALPSAVLELAATELRQSLGRDWRPLLEHAVGILADLREPVQSLEVGRYDLKLVVSWDDWWRHALLRPMWHAEVHEQCQWFHGVLCPRRSALPPLQVRSLIEVDRAGAQLDALAARLAARSAA
jgi:hypothetical protein